MKKYLVIVAVISVFMLLCSCSDERLYNNSYYEVSEEEETPTEPNAVNYEDNMNDYENSEYIGGNKLDDETIDEILRKLENEEAEEATEEQTEKATEKPREKSTEKPTEKSTEKTSEKTTEKATSAPKDEENNSEYKVAKRIEVPFRSQSDMPTGCELVSTSMLLNYYGFDIEPYSLIEEGYILTEEIVEKNNVLYGGDPNYQYIGNPWKNTGYGCYSGAIYGGLERLMVDEFFDVHDLTGFSLNDICKQYIDFDQPVLIWVTIGMEPLFYDGNSEWIIEETGKKFRWLSNEHCVVLVGYDDEYYYVNDPLKKAYTAYKRELMDKRYNEMGRQAVTIVEW